MDKRAEPSILSIIDNQLVFKFPEAKVTSFNYLCYLSNNPTQFEILTLDDI